MRTITKKAIISHLYEYPGMDIDKILEVLQIPKELLMEMLVERMELNGRIKISFVIHDDGFYEPFYKFTADDEQ